MFDVGWTVIKVAAALAVAIGIYLIGARVVANFSNSEPPPDPADQPLADVDYRYQCIVCGAQAVLYAAPEGEVPEAPRHCREPMMLVSPVE
ncbi:MAG TPA: hypothetical protein VN636_15165 [Acidimicrobiia bacterium]|nr:hypothetical protein [Acidimicrobiia bacterium]